MSDPVSRPQLSLSSSPKQNMSCSNPVRSDSALTEKSAAALCTLSRNSSACSASRSPLNSGCVFMMRRPRSANAAISLGTNLVNGRVIRFDNSSHDSPCWKLGWLVWWLMTWVTSYYSNTNNFQNDSTLWCVPSFMIFCWAFLTCHTGRCADTAVIVQSNC